MSKKSLGTSVKLNNHGVFRSVILSPDFGFTLTPEEKESTLQLIDKNLAALSDIKNDLSYQRFLRAETGFDIPASFSRLEQIPLHIYSLYRSDEMNIKVRKNKIRFVLNLNPETIKSENKKAAAIMFGHEIGHAVLHGPALVTDENNQITAIKSGTTYSDYYPQNHKIELACDKIGIALNPDADISTMLADPKRKSLFWGNQYACGKLGKKNAMRIAVFCKNRDDFVNTFFGTLQEKEAINCEHPKEYKKEPVQNRLNKFFCMNSQMTHPSNIVRMVEGDKFKARLERFKTTNPDMP